MVGGLTATPFLRRRTGIGQPPDRQPSRSESPQRCSSRGQPRSDRNGPQKRECLCRQAFAVWSWSSIRSWPDLLYPLSIRSLPYVMVRVTLCALSRKPSQESRHGGKSVAVETRSQPLCGQCGARLARDNSGVLCATCQRGARDIRVHAPLVPPGFWLFPKLRAALASKHIGRVSYMYRTTHAMEKCSPRRLSPGGLVSARPN